MIMGPEPAPELRDLVVVQAEERDADGAAGETAEDDLLRIAAELGADPRKVGLGVGYGGVDVAPPGAFCLLYTSPSPRD